MDQSGDGWIITPLWISKWMRGKVVVRPGRGVWEGGCTRKTPSMDSLMEVRMGDEDGGEDGDG